MSAYRPLRLVRAPNPGPMTLEGTNTWVLGDPAEAPPLVVDPGPLLENHLQAVLAAAGGRVGAVVLTHRHADHAESAAELGRRAGCAVWALDPALRAGGGALAEGTRIASGSTELTAQPTPGHTSDSCSFLLQAPGQPDRLLSGDTVLGRGTTVITDPDGDVGDYLRSLDRLQSLVRERQVAEILPGHGPRVASPATVLRAYRQHREQRLDQVRAALAAGDRTAAEVVARVYADVDRAVWPAAEQAVRAQLRFLGAAPPRSGHHRPEPHPGEELRP